MSSVISEIESPFTLSSKTFNNTASSCTLTVPYGTKDAYIAAGWTENVFKGGIVEAEPVSSNIIFADDNVKALCVANWDTNGDGELSEAEAAAVTDLGTVFKRNKNLSSFDELQYFTGLTSIGVSAFDGCSGLTSITIPSSVTTIGSSAFWNCTSLSSLTLPSSVTSIGGGAFSFCSGLTTITVHEGNPTYDSRNGCNAIIEKSTNTLIVGCKNTKIPIGIVKVGADAFVGCSGLTSITIPSSVTTIGLNAFLECTELASINIPNGVTSIGDNAFMGCSGLTSVISKIKEPFALGSNTFSGIASTCTLTVPNGTKDAYIAAGWTESVFKGGLSFNISFYDAYVKTLCVSNWDTNGDGQLNTIEAAAVTGLGNVFKNDDDITSFEELKYFTGLTSIGSETFYNCTELEAVIIPNNVISIGNGAFSGCEDLEYAVIPNSVKSIGNNAFSGCIWLSYITIPFSVTSIGASAFDGCIRLTSVISEIQDPFTLSSNAFNNISSNCLLIVPCGTKDAYIAKGWTESIFKAGIMEMESPSPIITFADTNVKNSCISGVWDSNGDGELSKAEAAVVTSINTMFSGKENITSFNELEYFTRLKSIGDYAFKNCKNLTSITLPQSVTSIGSNAFADCSGLTSVISNIEEPFTLGSSAFSGIASTCTLTVPDGAKDAYIAAGWTEDVFKGGIIEVEKVYKEQSMELASLPAKTYGDAAYTLPATTTQGLALTWSSGNTNVATISGNTLTVKGTGSATITAAQAGNDDYKPLSKEFTLTVAKAPLTITANDATKNVGDANPAFTASYEGFVGDDDATVLTAQPSFTCEATSESPAGTYDINVSGVEAANYEMTYVKGTLTVVDEWSMSSTLALTDAQVLCGRQIVLPVNMSNTEDITAIQFDLTLPAGVSIAKNSKGKYIVEKTERCADHTLSASKPGEANMYKVLLYSTEVESITGNEGAVINVTLEAAEDMEAGDYEVRISNINLTTTAEKKITPADATCVLTVRNSIPGDANGDGDIDVTDIVTIANYILGRASGTIDLAAADANGDGDIDVTDIVTVANIILHDGGANAVKVREAMQMLDPQ